MTNLIVRDAHVLTMDPRLPTASVIVVYRGQITWVGNGEPPGHHLPPKACDIRLRGRTVVPGFVDAHCHPFSLGFYLKAVDCGPKRARSIAEIQVRLREAASLMSRGRWLDAVGYDELHLVDRRHPTRKDLDEAIPDRPVRLRHSSGHAVVLNSPGLAAIGIRSETQEPPGGTIARDIETGEPSGLLFEMDDYVSARLPPRDETSLRSAVSAASQALVSAGVTSVTDAGHRNTSSRLQRYRDLRGEGIFLPRTGVMLAPGEARPEASTIYDVWPDATKIMVTTSSGELSPAPEQLSTLIRQSIEDATPGIAIHAVEREAVEAAVTAFEDVRDTPVLKRIEHASECSQDLIKRMADAGMVVVTQPGFISSRGERYLAGGMPSNNVRLYPIRSLFEAGVPVAAGSDAPFGPWQPLTAIAAAVTRRSDQGSLIDADQSITPLQALQLFGSAAGRLGGRSLRTGVLASGREADFVVLDADPTQVSPQSIADIHVLQTVIGGEVVWAA